MKNRELEMAMVWVQQGRVIGHAARYRSRWVWSCNYHDPSPRNGIRHMQILFLDKYQLEITVYA